ncbi:glutathione S-transferase [Marinobacter segnicrescens]|uniref:Glutathione S-transferase n=1 Tax=Marinobacter segnicrescens TaxID=430453 RepID=A0A1I0IIH2_9GAMM|nr:MULTISPECIES: glutathione S-transferase family protein [Marinobacter]MCK7542748.1 glutathione S-transferase family protein [Marinobacter bryozoorum]SET96825.1 glutathione S-transferase [Marinobacter segnicrescens]
MIKLYHCMSARSFRALWALEELGLDYELMMLPFPPRMFKKEYLGINPLGTIPAFFDGDTFMTESSAIAQYLAERYGQGKLNIPVDDPRYGAYLNWLHFGEATLTFPQTLVLRYTRLEPEERRVPQVAEDYKKWFLGRLRGVEASLEKTSPWILGDTFTTADISVAYALMLAENLNMENEFGPNTLAYWQRVQHRDAFKRALESQQEAATAQGIS